MNKIAYFIEYLKDINRQRIQNRPSKNVRGTLGKEASRLGKELAQALSQINGIPIIVISYNNFSYVDQMVAQLNQRGHTPVIIDNASTDANTKSGLAAVAQEGRGFVLSSGFNFKHTAGFIKPIYDALPEVFAYTDPDLKFSDDLPADFLSQLAELTREFGVYKAACALPLSVENHALSTKRNAIKLKSPFEFTAEHSIPEWEAKYWKQRLAHKLEIYSAQTDTTFAVYNKANYRGFFFDAIRVAGAFSAIHLPWFIGMDLMNAEEKSTYLSNNKSTSWK